MSLLFVTSCEDWDDFPTTGGGGSNPTNTADPTLIVLSAPSVYNNYYASAFDNIIDYMSDFANQIDAGTDEVVILVDADTQPYFNGKVSGSMLITANVEDVWIRDFGTVMPSKMVKFDYLPDFQAASTSNWIDNSFENWFAANGLTYSTQSNLILDGGNVVDNGSTRAIVTDRFLHDNPQLTYNQAVAQLKNLLGVNEVAIMPEYPGDATGHADGLVTWVGDNKILLHEMPQPQHNQAIQEFQYAFPGVEIVVVPDYYVDESWQGFSSACNIFVNSLVTDDYIYMPTFNTGHDAEMLQLFEANTNKEVVPVAAEGVCMMGGSVRCLSWQVKGANMDKILNLRN